MMSDFHTLFGIWSYTSFSIPSVIPSIISSEEICSLSLKIFSMKLLFVCIAKHIRVLY